MTPQILRTTDWLKEKAPGFRELPDEDRQVIFQFCILWSLFEAKALQTRASAYAILALAHERAATEQLNVTELEPPLQYFRQRYFVDGAFTDAFNRLRLRGNDNRELVRQVLQSANNNPADKVAVLLIVIYRLRNNLFHGVKWADNIRGQRDNFNHANSALMVAYEQLVRDDT